MDTIATTPMQSLGLDPTRQITPTNNSTMPTTGRRYLNGIPMTGSGTPKDFALPKALATFAKPVTSKIAPDDTINHFGHLPRNPSECFSRAATCCDAAIPCVVPITSGFTSYNFFRLKLSNFARCYFHHQLCQAFSCLLHLTGRILLCPRLEFRLQAARVLHHPLPRKRGTPNEPPACFGAVRGCAT